MTPQHKSIVILGSSRSDGNTKKIINCFADKKSIPIVDLNDYTINYYDYAHVNSDDDFIPIIERILNYDQIVFATPIYWYAMSAVLKTFFDRLSDLIRIRKDLGRQLKGKKIFLIACSSNSMQYDFFSKPFEKTAEYLEMEFGGFLHTWIEMNGEIDTQLKKQIETFSEML